MFDVRQGKEIVLRVRNETGLLLEIAKILTEKGLSIFAALGVVCGEECIIRIITDDNLRAKDALTEHRYGPEEEDVILVDTPNKPGMLRRIADALVEEDIDVRHIYTTALGEHDRCLIVLHTSADEHVIPTLNRMMG